MATKNFYQEQTEESAVKAKLVVNYFKAWAKVMQSVAEKHNRDKELTYFDLFCGPGRYDDGQMSVPLKLLSHAVNTPHLKENLITVFNDQDADFINSLNNEIDELPNIGNLKHQPKIFNEKIDEKIDEKFIEKIEKNMEHTLSFSFLDPWGYSGLSLKLIEALIKNWGCDCVFFFNYNRINMAMNNNAVESCLKALYGKKAFEEAKNELTNQNPSSKNRPRYDIILEKMVSALEQKGSNQKRFVLPFCFRNDEGTRITHHLFFVTKHFLGYEIMKEIMYKASTTHVQGVADFTYCQADIDKINPLLPGMTRPLDELKNKLFHKYKNKKVRFSKLYKEDIYGTPYIEDNYKEALLQMKEDGLIEVLRPASGKGSRKSFINVDIDFKNTNDDKIRN